MEEKNNLQLEAPPFFDCLVVIVLHLPLAVRRLGCKDHMEVDPPL